MSEHGVFAGWRPSGTVAEARLRAVPVADAVDLTELPSELGPVGILHELAPRREALSAQDMTTLARQALVLLDGFYVHLPLKRALHATDPVQRLRLLVQRLAVEPMTEAAFHDELTAVFTSLRDCHSLYLLPEPYRSSIAFLPFLIEECADGFLVTKTACERFSGDPEFVPGVRVTHWNGTEIARAIELLAAASPGANPPARRGRALDLLTFRWLGVGVRPAEDWVVISYEADGEIRHARFPWLVVERPSPLAAEADPSRPRALDPEGEWIRRVRRELFAGRSEDLVTFDRFSEGGKEYGHLRIWSFNVPDDGLEAFLAQVRALLEADPQPDGLIVDIRGNPGGDIRAGERLLQLLTPARIQPVELQFLNTEPSAAVATGYYDQRGGWGREFRYRRADAFATAAPVIPGFPLVEEDECNDVGQRFQGPVVLLVDALSYSTSDVFAAGFEDHAIGDVIGTSRQTGAGGGNVWTYEELRDGFPPDATSPFVADLPLGASFTLAVRRITRVGRNRGLLLEDLGVVVDDDDVHPLTRADVLEGNPDLRRHAVATLEQLARGGRHRLRAELDGDFVLSASETLARVDVYVDGRPFATCDGPGLDGRRIALAGASPQTARFEGFTAPDARAPVVAWQWVGQARK